jgi:hypothetical protein
VRFILTAEKSHHRSAAALWQLHGRTAWPLPCFSRQEYADVVACPAQWLAASILGWFEK